KHRDRVDEAVKLSAQNHVSHKNSQDERDSQALERFFKGLGASRKYQAVTAGQNFFPNFFHARQGFTLGFIRRDVAKNPDGALAVSARDGEQPGLFTDLNDFRKPHHFSLVIADPNFADVLGAVALVVYEADADVVTLAVAGVFTHAHSPNHGVNGVAD